MMRKISPSQNINSALPCKREKFIAGLIIVFIMMITACGHKIPAEKTEGKIKVKISVLPAYSLPLMTERFVPLINYLSETTGYKIEYVSSLSYGGYLTTLESAQADIGYQNPLFYIILAKTKGAYPLVKAVDINGDSSYRGVIITHINKGIEDIGSLRDKKVMAVSKKAIGGYLAQASLCVQNKIDPEKNLTIILAKSQDEVISRVYQQKVDAGFVREDVLRAVKDKIDLNKIKIIAYTEYFPNWCFAAFSHTDKDVAEKIKQALLGLDKKNPDHYKILEKAEVSGFIETHDTDYDIMRKKAEILKVPY
ncbi:MAG: PhnD/SsuA/transferrin family substrate-binding protein [Candidatus Aminicenantes bacterium]|nr:PhnD/SsuA/transferrin family substrate-binding protein [Candidatus Aminicenantes bacterium]